MSTPITTVNKIINAVKKFKKKYCKITSTVSDTVNKIIIYSVK